MATFRCRACGREGKFEYQAGRHACPCCGSPDVQFAVGIEEFPDDDPLIQAMEHLAEKDREKNDMETRTRGSGRQVPTACQFEMQVGKDPKQHTVSQS